MKTIAKPTQKALAAALGIDPAMVSRDKRKGMPIHSIEAAQRWRDENLRVRYTPEKDYGAVTRAIDGESAAKQASSLLHAAGELWEAGGDVFPMLYTIKQAMASVPPSQRNRVLVSFEVMDLLTAEVRLFKDRDDFFDLIEGKCYPCDKEAGDDGFMGAFWYSVAAGEVWLKCPTG